MNVNNKNKQTLQVKVEEFNFNNRNLFEIACSIRRRVFVVEQNVDTEMEFDGLDNISRHYLLYFENTPVATARWRETDRGYKLERFAVLRVHRKSGFGYQILKKILADILPTNKTIYAHAQIGALAFYKKHGFAVTGSLFVEADIEHYKVVYTK